MEVVRVLEELRERIESPKQFLGITFGLNKAECAVLIRRIHTLLPEQVKQAAVITRESERIVDSAKEDATLTLERAKGEAARLLETARRDAEKVLQQAQVEREKMLNQNEILRIAKDQAEKVRGDAEQEASRLRRSADDYALDVLARLESSVGKVMGAIERGKSELQRPTQALVGSKPK